LAAADRQGESLRAQWHADSSACVRLKSPNISRGEATCMSRVGSWQHRELASQGSPGAQKG
jgi:hypothetical protein